MGRLAGAVLTLAAFCALGPAVADAATLATGEALPLGTRSVGSQTKTVAAGDRASVRLTAKADGPVDVVNVNLAAGSKATSVRATLYAADGARLGSGKVTARARTGWQSVRISPVGLTKGETYRLALAGKGGALKLKANASGQASAYAAEAYKVLVFTKNNTIGAVEGVAALRALADAAEVTFDATDDATKFSDASLATYRAVVFLNTSGDVLDDAQQAAFEKYFRGGGGFLGIHSAIETEPTWQFMTDILGTRSSTQTDPLQATVKPLDRVHVASKNLPEYWSRTDRWYNFTSNVRGQSHVVATVDTKTFTGSTMGPDHPIAWCKDYRGGRSFYTALGGTTETFAEADVRKHLAGALDWTVGKADKTYSDCGATVLANYAQTKISAQPNISEPIGIEVLPDGRILQTARGASDGFGTVRLHDPKTGSVTIVARFGVYANEEDGMYGPAIDNEFASNKWVYLFYSPVTVENVKQSDGTTRTITTPPGSAPGSGPTPATWDPYVGYFQLSRFKFVDATATEPAHLDLGTEQQIMRVSNNRGACCHVAGDIDFDKHNNLWMVTGDDTGAGAGNSGGFGPFNDMKTNETQTVRVNAATGGTFTLTFDGQTTEPIPWNATNAVTRLALEALSNIEVGDVVVTGNTFPNQTQTVNFRAGKQQTDVPQMTSTSSLTGTGAALVHATTQQGDYFVATHVDARRGSQNTNDLRGKILRIKVAADGSYTIPEGNLFAPGTAKTRPEIYAMGFRNPFRIQVDENEVAYVTDYSPDSQTPQNFRGPAGTGRVEIVRKPSNYGWPMCYSPNLPYYRWDFNTSTPLDNPPQQYECNNPTRGPQNSSRWVRDGGPAVEPGLEYGPPITQPDIWYSYQDNRAVNPLGTPCLAYYDGSGGTCPQLFPELLGTSTSVAPHGATKYHYDATNPSTKKFPPYYDNSVIFTEWGRDFVREIKLDAQNKIFKISNALDCGQANLAAPIFPFECDNPMDSQFGTDGSFYMLTYGDGFSSINPDAALYRWDYVKGQRAPNAVLTASRTDGPAPLTVQFSSAGTRDADPGDSLFYEWDFDGNGTVDSTDPDGSFTYTTRGVYSAKLTVKDPAGNADFKTTVITVGNTSPTITITTPVDGGFFDWGNHIPYQVTVVDPEDGTVDCTKVRVTFFLVHDQHGHGEDNRTGCKGYLNTVADDASHGGSLAGAVSVSYTDTGGAGGVPALTTTTQNVVQLKRQQAEYVFEQSGTNVAAVPAAEQDPGGGQQRGSLDSGDWIGINRPLNFLNSEQQISFRVAGGSAATVGQPRFAIEVRQDSITGPLVTTATILATTGNTAYSTQTFAFTNPVVGSHRLFLVFRSITGGAANAFGNLNWVEFAGDGVDLPTDTPPTTTASFSPSQSACEGACTAINEASVITLTGADDVEVTGTEYRVDGGAWTPYTAPFKLSLQYGLHTLEYRSTDVDGNVEAAKSSIILFNPSEHGDVGGSVPATLALSLGTPAAFGAFTPGVTKNYLASTTASVISTAGNAALSVADPSVTSTGHLVNGAFSLPSALQAMATSTGGVGSAFAEVGGSASPTSLLSYSLPVSNDQVAMTFQQRIASTDALRTGVYSKTLTFTLSTTTP